MIKSAYGDMQWVVREYLSGFRSFNLQKSRSKAMRDRVAHVHVEIKKHPQLLMTSDYLCDWCISQRCLESIFETNTTSDARFVDSRNWCLLHDNIPSLHSNFWRESTTYHVTTYSPDLSTTGYFLFTKLKLEIKR